MHSIVNELCFTNSLIYNFTACCFYIFSVLFLLFGLKNMRFLKQFDFWYKEWGFNVNDMFWFRMVFEKSTKKYCNICKKIEEITQVYMHEYVLKGIPFNDGCKNIKVYGIKIDGRSSIKFHYCLIMK